MKDNGIILFVNNISHNIVEYRSLFRCLQSALLCLLPFLTISARAQGALPEDRLYFTVTASRTACYEQEAVLLTYSFHAYGDMRLSIGMNRKPDFQGLVSQEIPQPDDKAVRPESANGRVQRTGVMKQLLVFPQRAGRITVPGLTFVCKVTLHDEGGWGKEFEVTRQTSAVTLDVAPLPEPRPRGFSGAVGQFDVRCETPDGGLTTGDIATRRLTLSGKGNLRLVAPPAPRFRPGATRRRSSARG